MSDERANIKIDDSTRRRLKVWAAERDITYDEAINRLLDHYENTESA